MTDDAPRPDRVAGSREQLLGEPSRPDPQDRVAVAVAVLWRDGRILVRLRKPDEVLAGTWEFPGGKVRSGESPEAAARREVREEMSVEANALALLEVIEHDYPDRSVRISVFGGTCTGDPAPPDRASWAWVTPEELGRLPVPEANHALVARLARSAATPPASEPEP